MSKVNPLAGLVGSYGDSDDDSDEDTSSSKIRNDYGGSGHGLVTPGLNVGGEVAESIPGGIPAVHPPPVVHCLWSACYDEGSGYTYYWNQQTNEVTWEAPPEYLLALKLAQQQMTVAGSSEVSAEEWQLYQQALAEKQKPQPVIAKPPVTNPSPKPVEKQNDTSKITNGKYCRKRKSSDSDIEKIELITSYSNTDSDSNDESDSPKKKQPNHQPIKEEIKTPAKKVKQKEIKPEPKTAVKKVKSKVEYGPLLPPNQEYTVPIGPEMPPELKGDQQLESNGQESTERQQETEDDDLLKKLKDKAKLLEKLGGEVPKELHKLIKDEEEHSRLSSPIKSVNENSTDSKNLLDTNVDDLLAEIEQKELPKVKNNTKTDISEEYKEINSPKEVKPLFPSANTIIDEPKSLFPSATNIEPINMEIQEVNQLEVKDIEKKPNIYLSEGSDVKVTKKKLRISNSVLPERKISDVPSYTTKYSTVFEGSGAGLGFSQNEDENEGSSKKAFTYGKGLMFTKGETLNENKKDEALEDNIELLEAKLRFLNQQQMYPMSPIQEMTIQMQTLLAAYRSQALTLTYLHRWLDAAMDSLQKLEDSAAPAGWQCRFHRVEGRYEYLRLSDGTTQWEYPGSDDMDICTTPPPPPIEDKQPPVPVCPAVAVPVTEPPPPGTRDPPPPAPPPPPPAHSPPPPPPPPTISEPEKEIGDELLSFYSDIAEMESQTPPLPTPTTNHSSPERKPEPLLVELPPAPIYSEQGKALEKDGKNKKKTKVKISSTIGLKHKAVSSLVAKWQQVAEEIHSD